MIWKLLIALALMAFCVTIHAAGFAAALRRLGPTAALPTRFGGRTWLFVRVAGWMIVLHLIEIAAWALFYYWRHAIPDLQDAFYFSAVTYTTTGYGDLVLPATWRLVGGVEALTGILMCGWSTGFFFTIVSRLHQRQPQPSGA